MREKWGVPFLRHGQVWGCVSKLQNGAALERKEWVGMGGGVPCGVKSRSPPPQNPSSTVIAFTTFDGKHFGCLRPRPRDRNSLLLSVAVSPILPLILALPFQRSGAVQFAARKAVPEGAGLGHLLGPASHGADSGQG